VSELADPAARLMMHRPSGIILPGFRVRGKTLDCRLPIDDDGDHLGNPLRP